MICIHYFVTYEKNWKRMTFDLAIVGNVLEHEVGRKRHLGVFGRPDMENAIHGQTEAVDVTKSQ